MTFIEKIVLCLVLICLSIYSIKCYNDIEQLKKEYIELKQEYIELKQEYENFKEITSNEIIGQWRSLARVRRNFQVLKWGGLESLDTEQNERTENEIRESYARH